MHRSTSVSSEGQQVKSCHWDGSVYEVNVFRIMKCCGTANGDDNALTLTQRSTRLQ